LNQAAPTAAAEWHRNWPLVAAATSGMSLAALSTSAFGVMVVPIEQEFHWTRAQISTGPLLVSVMTVLFGTVLGLLVDRLGPRIIALGNVTLLCAATALLSQIGPQLWQWWAIWIVIGLCSAILPTLCVMPTTRTFNLGRGLAMAIVLSGSGISSFVVPNLGNWLVEHYGWQQAYLYLALIWYAVVFTLMLLFLRVPQAGAEPVPTQKEQTQPPPGDLPGLTAREGLTSPVFYRLLFAAVIANFVGIAIILNLIPILRWTGLDAMMAASVMSLIGIFTIVGRIIAGGLIDRFDAGRIAGGASLLMFALPAMLLAFPGNIATSIAGVVIVGMMGGAQTPCIAYLASRHLGQRAYATLYATIMAAMSLGVGLGPLFANMVYDATQSYNIVLWAALPMFVIGALLFMSLGPYPNFSRKDEEA
jgi:predicted MFS family arabinose efflux permease